LGFFQNNLLLIDVRITVRNSITNRWSVDARSGYSAQYLPRSTSSSETCGTHAAVLTSFTKNIYEWCNVFFISTRL